jgi:hypothetical protein
MMRLSCINIMQLIVNFFCFLICRENVIPINCRCDATCSRTGVND